MKIESGKTLRDYITEYQAKANNTQIHRLANLLGLNEDDFRTLVESRPTEANINEYGRFDKVKESFDKKKAEAFLEEMLGITLAPFEVKMELDKFLRKIVLEYDNGILNTILSKEGE